MEAFDLEENPVQTDNAVRPEDGEQPTEEELAAILASLEDDE